MTESNDDSADNSFPNPNLKEQDKGIIEVFSREDHRVLTNNEIAENVSLSERQVRRRLDELEEKDVIGKRKAGGVNLAWLEKDVEEPITVRYPLLRYVRDHISIQLFLIGVAGGIVSLIVLLTAALSVGYDINLLYLNREQLFSNGILAAVFSAVFIIAGVLLAIANQILRQARRRIG
jgi:hypothetical protein